jgi:hypothetical protein
MMETPIEFKAQTFALPAFAARMRTVAAVVSDGQLVEVHLYPQQMRAIAQVIDKEAALQAAIAAGNYVTRDEVERQRVAAGDRANAHLAYQLRELDQEIDAAERAAGRWALACAALIWLVALAYWVGVQGWL